MASDSTDEDSIEVTVPRDLAAWLDDRATELGVDRTVVLEELVAAHRAAAELDGEPADLAADAVSAGDFDDRIRAIVDERLAAALDERVAEAVAAQESSGVDEEVAGTLDDLEAQVDDLSTDLDEKIQDVRERVIQVKRDADARAPREHTHEELERVDALADRLDDLEGTMEEVATRLESSIEDERRAREEGEDRVDDLEERLEEATERLQTVAWVVSDLREAHEEAGLDTVDRIKQAAAAADIQRAKCGNCGEGVQLSLLTEPRCPHCEATVTDVETDAGWFGSPTLTVAAQLESGE